MKIGIQSIHFNADKNLLAFIERKTSKLDLFYDQIIQGDVYLKLDKASDETNKVSQIKLMIPGSVLYAKGQCRSFEEGIDLAIESLRKQILKHKRKVDLKEFRENKKKSKNIN